MWWKLCPFHYGSQIIKLNSETLESVPITQINEFGAYDIVVEDADDKENGAISNFTISANKVNGGSIFRSTASCGMYSEHVCITWKKGTVHPHLKYMGAPVGDDAPLEQNFKVVFRKTA